MHHHPTAATGLRYFSFIFFCSFPNDWSRSWTDGPLNPPLMMPTEFFNLRDQRYSAEVGDTLELRTVLFPLLAVVIPKWLDVLEAEGARNCTKMLLLVSGTGLPRNPNINRESNSTKILALLIQEFVTVAYPEFKFIQCPSDDDIYRYARCRCWQRCLRLPLPLLPLLLLLLLLFVLRWLL